MLYETLENEIKARLVAKITEFVPLIEVVPEKQEDYKKGEKGAITVVYQSSKWDKPKSTGYTVQEETMAIDLFIKCKNLRGVNGIWDLQNKARLALVGWAPSNCNRLFAMSFDFVKREDGIFTYVFTVGGMSQAVMSNDQTDAPLPTEITHIPDSPSYDTLVIELNVPEPEPEE